MTLYVKTEDPPIDFGPVLSVLHEISGKISDTNTEIDVVVVRLSTLNTTATQIKNTCDEINGKLDILEGMKDLLAEIQPDIASIKDNTSQIMTDLTNELVPDLEDIRNFTQTTSVKVSSLDGKFDVQLSSLDTKLSSIDERLGTAQLTREAILGSVEAVEGSTASCATELVALNLSNGAIAVDTTAISGATVASAAALSTLNVTALSTDGRVSTIVSSSFPDIHSELEFVRGNQETAQTSLSLLQETLEVLIADTVAQTNVVLHSDEQLVALRTSLNEGASPHRLRVSIL